jgi:hypothetical protein
MKNQQMYQQEILMFENDDGGGDNNDYNYYIYLEIQRWNFVSNTNI